MTSDSTTQLIGAEPWRQIASTCGERELMEYILTGWERKGWHDRECPLWHWLDPQDRNVRVLDLGCGLGRTLHELRQATMWELTGYDTPEMIRRASAAVSPGIQWESDWSRLTGQSWTCVHACFVFQHVSPLAIRSYCRDLPGMTSLIVVRGRDWNDHTRGPVAELLMPLEQAGFAMHEVERDGDHSTRVCRRL